VRADQERVRQILLNLLTNAIKFTDAGGSVTVACGCSDDTVWLSVTDTGRGIEPDKLQRIFEPFVQVDRHLTNVSQQGVGLGLAISRDLARRMDGDIAVESELGRGSTFILSLPRAAVSGRAPLPRGEGVDALAGEVHGAEGTTH
jgi:signal transduction histidine kinase